MAEMPKNKRESGLTLVELIVTIAIMAFGVVGLWDVFNLLIQPQVDNTMRFTASELAQEGVEIVRNMRNNNVIANPPAAFSSGLSQCESGCVADYKTDTSQGSGHNVQSYSGQYLGINQDGMYDYCGSNCVSTSPFQRDIVITFSSPNKKTEMDIDVTVSWNYNGKSYSQEEKGVLYNWYSQ